MRKGVWDSKQLKETCLTDSVNLYVPRSKVATNQSTCVLAVCSRESFFSLLTMNGEWRWRSRGETRLTSSLQDIKVGEMRWQFLGKRCGRVQRLHRLCDAADDRFLFNSADEHRSATYGVSGEAAQATEMKDAGMEGGGEGERHGELAFR
jgi:hypothetical protein